MRRLCLLLALLPMLLWAQTSNPVIYANQQTYGNLPPLHVEGKYFKDVNGNRVVLHGCMDTPNPYFNSYRWQQTGGMTSSTSIANCLAYFDKLFDGMTNRESGAYCNLFRLHMDPCWTNDNGIKAAGFTEKDGKVYDPHGQEVGGEANIYHFSLPRLKTYLKSVYWPIAQRALRHGLYVIVRPPGVCPHTIKVGDYYNEYLMTVWDTFSQNDSVRKYSGQIMIELANEPVNLLAANGQRDAKAKHDYFQPIVDKIRSNGFDGIVLAPGTGWQSSYEDYAQYPIEGANIGYAVHNYAGWYGGSDDAYDRASNKQTYINNYINQFKKQVPVVETNPIVITEVDWSPKKEGTGHYNEHNEWVESNYGTWATASTSKWGVGYKALLDHCGNISMTLTSIDAYMDINHMLATWRLVKNNPRTVHCESTPAFGGLAEASGKACFDWYAEYAKVDYPRYAYSRAWTADLGYGKFINPILNGDFPDPDVIRVGDTYYMVSTTFYIFPGCTLLKSKDLVNWEYCANPLQQLADNDNYNLLNGKNHYSQGQWAASLNYHNGKFYIYFISYGKNGEDEGKNVMLTATNPESTWDMEYWPEHYYDSGWLFDDGANGDGYVYVACGINDIWVNKLDGKTLKKLGSTRILSMPDSGLEGCHMYHIGEYYYIYATYGGTEGSQTIFRSKNPMGPYEECVKEKTTLNPKGRLFAGQHIHQGGLVETQTGEWWTILFRDAGAIGRIPYLEPVTWGEDGWPSIGLYNSSTKDYWDVSKGSKAYPKPNVGANYPRTSLPTNDTFTDLQLGMQWGWNHNPDNTAWSLLENPGSLRLHTVGITTQLDQARNSLTQRIMGNNSADVSMTTKAVPSYGTIKMDVSQMKEGDKAGLSVFQDPYSYIGVTLHEGKPHLLYYRSAYTTYDWGQGKEIAYDAVETLGEELSHPIVYLRAKVNFLTNKVEYSYSTDNQTYHAFGAGMDMRFTLKYFTGQRFHLFNFATQQQGGYVDIDWFSTEPTYSEELYFSEEALKTYSVEDATAQSLTIDRQQYTVMPSSKQAFTVTCTMLSGMQNNVTTACAYRIENSEVATVQGGQIVGVGVGSTRVTATYTDLLGKQVSQDFTVVCSYFPLSSDAINPSLIGTGTFTFNEVVHEGILRPAGNGAGGWHYSEGVNMTGIAKYLVVKLGGVTIARPDLKLYDSKDLQADAYVLDMTGKKEVVIDLEEVGKQIDLTHVYYVLFQSKNRTAYNIRLADVFFSNDGVNPIEGSATRVEGITQGVAASEILRTEYYSVDGRRLPALQRGVNIVRHTFTDGHVESIKVTK